MLDYPKYGVAAEIISVALDAVCKCSVVIRVVFAESYLCRAAERAEL